jgi:hypothetical protein
MSFLSFSLMSKGGPMMWVLLCLGIDALWSTGVLLRWGDIDLLAPSRLRRKYRTA